MAIPISRLTVSIFLLAVVSHAVPLFAQPTEQPAVPPTVHTGDLKPGMWCQVTFESPANSGVESLLGYAGTIQEINKDEIVLVTTCDYRMEKRVPILAALPYIGKYFTTVSIGRDVVTRRIPIAKIAAIECRGGAKGDDGTTSPERMGVDFK